MYNVRYDVISLFRLLPESIPWLVANNKKKEAEAILYKAAKFNGITLPGYYLKNNDEIYSLKQNVLFKQFKVLLMASKDRYALLCKNMKKIKVKNLSILGDYQKYSRSYTANI